MDIWRIRKSTTNRFIFRQNHNSGFIQRKLDYVFVTNSLQESIQKTNILPSFTPFIFLYNSYSFFNLRKNFWKFNRTVKRDETYITQMKEYINLIRNEINDSFAENSHAKWEFLKYAIRKLTITY